MTLPPIGSPMVQSPALPPRPKSAAELSLANLRGVQWRIYLGILSSSPSSSIDDYRRGAAESRRRYARLRRRLLIDPHLPKDGSAPIDPAVDNPLSQNPDSTWGRFFRNAELERMLDQDLSRLYPEHGSYFQSSQCQAMLRRVLLVWCLRHPEYGYRQGMHELLAPLLYVLHVDIQRHFEVRKKHEDLFTDEFERSSFPENDRTSHYKFTKTANWNDSTEGAQTMPTRAESLDELDPETRVIILLSDAYGAEGELGIVLSDRFMEHDAYCMFDALMNGSHGVVVMAEFFSPSPLIGSNAFLLPVIEASSALYHLLSVVDSCLHSHLVELGVEPHYFAMRWLRVLFGREFSLDDLLIIWDEIFSCSNGMSYLESDVHKNFKVLSSPRGAFISALAVSMILHLRSSLLATEHATSCLQKLLNFPENIDVKKLIEKARSLQALAFDAYGPKSPSGVTSDKTTTPKLSHSLSMGSSSPKAALYTLPESYWERKWRVLHKEEEVPAEKKIKPITNGIIKRLRTEKLNLFRTESDPSSLKNSTVKKEPRPSVKRNLLEDLSREATPIEQTGSCECTTADDVGHTVSETTEEAHAEDYAEVLERENISNKTLECRIEVASSVGENSSCLSSSSSPVSVINDHDNESEDGHAISNSHSRDSDDGNSSETKSISSSDPCAASSSTRAMAINDVTGNSGTVAKEKKVMPSKFSWFWRPSKTASETTAEKGGMHLPQNSEAYGCSNKDLLPSVSDGSKFGGKREVGDKIMMGTLKNLGTSMLENIQVIESVFHQDADQCDSLENLSSNMLGSKGQATVLDALRELRKISALLSEM